MKKTIYIIIFTFALIVFLPKIVLASGSSYYSGYYNYYSVYVDLDTTIVDNLVSYYNTNLSSSYEYYVVRYNPDTNWLELVATHYNSVFSYLDSLYINNSSAGNTCAIHYNFTNEQYTYTCGGNSLFTNYLVYSTSSDFTFSDSTSCSAGLKNNCADVLQLPSYSNLEYDVSFPQIDLEEGDVIPTYMSLTNGSPTADFTTIDMSQYEYVILSLKDYNVSTFNTTIYSQGRLCFTPVYNYGMTQKQNIISDSQTQGCTESYSSLTPVSIYIIQADIDNHAVYYIKRYNSESNTIKVPSTIFDITYITSQNVNNPTAIVGGRTYPVIPYSDLTDTANISTETGYISGQVCSLGDVNCEYRTIGLDISDLWTQPIKVLQSVWASITSVFAVITEFIMLIPSPLREFLISAFFLSVILGVLKILI